VILTVEQAIEILGRFQDVAPASAADKLSQVMYLLRAQDAEIAFLNTQLQEAQEMLTVAAVTPVEAQPNGTHATATPPVRPRHPFERTVTDQLADIFDMLSTAEVAQAVIQDPISSAESRMGLEVAGLDFLLEDSSDEIILQEDREPEDSIAWLREAMPQILLTDEERARMEHVVHVVTAPLSHPPTAGIELMQPLQDALRPAMLVIRDEADRLYSGKLGGLTTEQTATMRVVRSYADSALSLLTAVEQVALIQAGKFRVQLTTFSCIDLIKRAREMMQPSARAKDHRITVYPPDIPPVVDADFEASLAILIDLLDNAIRYTPSGGAIRITVDNLGTHALINVADTGIGLQVGDFEHVGSPFWRATHQPLVQENPGSGLRLYIARQILALQKGELIFSGEPDGGSTFSFTLPLADS
jgi:signal transduction histidine kinase